MPAQTGLKDVSSVTDVTVAASPIFGPVTCDTFPTLFRGIERKRKKKSFVVKKQNRKTRSPIAPGLASRTCHLSQRGAPMWLGPGPWSAGGMTVPYIRPVS